jgi:hypothetical protein
MNHCFPCRVALVFLALLLSVVACSSTDPPDQPEVEVPLLLGLGVSPLYPVIPVGGVIQFRATGYLEDMTTVDMTDVVDWQSWNTEVLDITEALDWEGKALGVAAGSSRVRAVHEDVTSNEVRVTVIDAELEQLTVSPPSVTLEEGDRLQLLAEAGFSDGSYGDVTGSVQWVTDDPQVVTVWPDGELVGEGEGLTYVGALWESPGMDPVEAMIAVQVVEPGFQIPPPDLRVTQFTGVVVEDTVHWTATVENVGGRAASTFWVEFWLDRSGAPPAPPALGDGYEVVSVLGAGESRVVTSSMSDVPDGDFESWILVDSLGVVEEGDEENNVAGPEELTVDASGGQGSSGVPDIDVLWLEGFTVTDPDGVFYFVDLQNLGDGATGAFSVALYADQSVEPSSSLPPDDLIEVESVEPGEIRYLAREVPGILTSSWQSWVLADPSNQVEESEEGNNSMDALIVPE